MRRRDFIAMAGGAAAAWPVAARAQATKVRRIGVLMNARRDGKRAAVVSVGVCECASSSSAGSKGSTVRIDVRWNAGKADLARMYSGQLIGLMPDVILVASTTNLIAVQQATSTVPIVFVQTTDPVVQGFVPNLTRPGGNITGLLRHRVLDRRQMAAICSSRFRPALTRRRRLVQSRDFAAGQVLHLAGDRGCRAIVRRYRSSQSRSERQPTSKPPSTSSRISQMAASSALPIPTRD